MFQKTLIVTTLFLGTVFAQPAPEIEIAESSLQMYLSAANSSPDLFPGLTAQARLAAPIPFITQMNDEAQRDATPKALLFPVMVQSKIIALLRLDQTTEGWAVSELGLAGLAAEIEKIKKAWPSNRQNLLLFEDPTSKQYFFSIEGEAEGNLTRITFSDPIDPEVVKYSTLTLSALEAK